MTEYIPSQSLIKFRERMARSPMLSSFGGGSLRGFNPGVVGAAYPENWGEYSTAGGSNVPSHNYAPSASTGWGYGTSVADVKVWKGDVDWVFYGVGGGGISTGSQSARIRIYDLGSSLGSSGSLVYDEDGFSYAVSTFYSYELGDGGNGNGGTLPLLTAGNYYQVEQTYSSTGGGGHWGTNNNTSQTAQGVTVTTHNFNTIQTSGYTDNGTSTTSGQQFWLAAAAADYFT